MTIIFSFLLLIWILIVSTLAFIVRKNRVLTVAVIASGVIASIAACGAFVYVIEHNTM